jgi:hypothetical protein
MTSVRCGHDVRQGGMSVRGPGLPSVLPGKTYGIISIVYVMASHPCRLGEGAREIPGLNRAIIRKSEKARSRCIACFPVMSSKNWPQLKGAISNGGGIHGPSKNDYITLREASGHHVLGRDKNRREFSLYVVRDIMQRLIGDRSVYEDESKRASGFRLYRLTGQGRSRCDLRRMA